MERRLIMINELVTCKRDGFPMINLGGRWQCVAEYLDRCLGQQRITNVIQRDNTLYYIFENGHELPLLCFCCGQPLACENLSKEREGLCGRRLEAMTWDVSKLDDGREVIDFRLEFSAKERGTTRLQVPTSLRSANQMRHPATCPEREIVPTAAGHSSRKRHRRK
jgi:hypothetical protein